MSSLKYIPFFIAAVLTWSSCQTNSSQSPQNQDQQSKDTISYALEEFNIPNTSIRALEALNDSTVWFAGSNGYWGYTENNGQDWHIHQMQLDTVFPEFRSIAITDNGFIYLVSIAHPAAIFKSTDLGQNWKKVYQDTSENAFFDAIEFWNDEQGILLGDAVHQCFHIATTNDGGNTWQRVNCSQLPPALENENPFAASNTNVSLSDSHTWFVTGGKSKSRVYHSSNYGLDWDVEETPIVSGQTMTGIYSVQFISPNIGMIAGGNWENVTEKNNHMALTRDGGQTWKVLNDNSMNGYISCIQFVPGSNGKEILALSGRSRGGISQMYYSSNMGESWQKWNNTNYLAIQFASPNAAWISGNEKIGKLTLNKGQR
ncbi:oxidoreductase [bacterium SCSIO 12643]|nr:oxidoreductase [bacterium SCSIO 12643]